MSSDAHEQTAPFEVPVTDADQDASGPRHEAPDDGVRAGVAPGGEGSPDGDRTEDMMPAEAAAAPAAEAEHDAGPAEEEHDAGPAEAEHDAGPAQEEAAPAEVPSREAAGAVEGTSAEQDDDDDDDGGRATVPTGDAGSGPLSLRASRMITIEGPRAPAPTIPDVEDALAMSEETPPLGTPPAPPVEPAAPPVRAEVPALGTAPVSEEEPTPVRLAIPAAAKADADARDGEMTSEERGPEEPASEETASEETASTERASEETAPPEDDDEIDEIDEIDEVEVEVESAVQPSPPGPPPPGPPPPAEPAPTAGPPPTVDIGDGRADDRKPPPPPPPPKKPEKKKNRDLPPPSEQPRSQRRPWWEEVFHEDYARATKALTPTQLNREVEFIDKSLGVAPGGVLLDLACGTGEHAVELASRGYAVVGYDLSLFQLALAADYAQERGQRLNFLQGDMREMAFEEMFDGIYCWNTSFGYFEEEKNLAVAQRIYKALRPGGMLLLDIANRDFVSANEPSSVWYEGDACVCMDDMNMDFITSRLRVKRSLILDDGRSREVQFSIRVYTLHEIGKLLHQVGFRITEVSGDLSTPRAFFGASSPRLIILAQRP